MGALVSPKPEHLYQFGVMGSIFSHDVLRQKTPRIGLLNIGEEEGKGTEVHKAAWKLLKSRALAFVGTSRQRSVPEQAEVVVTDGFTGNVVLKLMEESRASCSR